MPAKAVFDDLEFGFHYWNLREFLYYSHNAPGSIAWTFVDDQVKIAYADPSLPRHIFISANNENLASHELFGGSDRAATIEGLLRDVPEFEHDPALALVEEEVDVKFGAYFNLVPDLDGPLDGHSFGELRETYRILLAKALWHRYHSSVNRSRGVVLMSLDELADNLAKSSKLLTADAVRWAVRLMSYGSDSRARGENPVYFSLYRLPPDDRVQMLPHDFPVWEGFVNLLRLIALRWPEAFLRHFSGPIGTGLTRRMAAAFMDAGFGCRSDLSLRQYSAELPDVDLLVISHEPTLGFALLFCEVKAPIPSSWAKDQLRVLQADSIAKAFPQLQRIQAFLETLQGIDFIRSLLPAEGLADFDEFAGIVRHLVITSHNAGAFFADRGTIVVDYQTLSRLLRRCDGDMLYVTTALAQLGEYADRCFSRVDIEVDVGDMHVTYEGVVLERLLNFAQARFRSAGVPQQMTIDMLEAGLRPLDTLRMLGLLGDPEV